MAMFDYLIASLCCAHCGKVSPADNSTDMQTQAFDSACMRIFQVGDRVVVADMDDINYYQTNKNLRRKSLSFIEDWTCPSCLGGNNWAKMVINDGMIFSIESISINEREVSEANFVSPMCNFYGWTISDGAFVLLQQ